LPATGRAGSRRPSQHGGRDRSTTVQRQWPRSDWRRSDLRNKAWARLRARRGERLDHVVVGAGL
jgi:hypothetical protein